MSSCSLGRPTTAGWTGVEVGVNQYADWTDADLKQFLPAFCYMLDYVREQNPQAQILCVINDAIKPEIQAGLMETALHFRATPVALAGIDKSCDHPTRLGMQQIAAQIAQALER